MADPLSAGLITISGLSRKDFKASSCSFDILLSVSLSLVWYKIVVSKSFNFSMILALLHGGVQCDFRVNFLIDDVCFDPWKKYLNLVWRLNCFKAACAIGSMSDLGVGINCKPRSRTSRCVSVRMT